MKREALYKTLTSLILLITLTCLYGENNNIPVYPNAVIIQKPNESELNSMKMLSMIYVVKKQDDGDNIKSIETFYLRELNQRNFNVQKVDRSKIEDSSVINIHMISKEKKIKIVIEDRMNENKIYVKLNVIDNISLFSDEEPDINNKKDNPGFDFDDIPRSPSFIRIMSVKADTKKQNALSQVTYKTVTHKDTLIPFYHKEMPKKGWVSERVWNQKTIAMLSFIKQKRKCDIMILYNKELKQNMVMIQVSEK